MARRNVPRDAHFGVPFAQRLGSRDAGALELQPRAVLLSRKGVQRDLHRQLWGGRRCEASAARQQGPLLRRVSPPSVHFSNTPFPALASSSLEHSRTLAAQLQTSSTDAQAASSSARLMAATGLGAEASESRLETQCAGSRGQSGRPDHIAHSMTRFILHPSQASAPPAPSVSMLTQLVMAYSSFSRITCSQLYRGSSSWKKQVCAMGSM